MTTNISYECEGDLSISWPAQGGPNNAATPRKAVTCQKVDECLLSFAGGGGAGGGGLGARGQGQGYGGRVQGLEFRA